MTKIKISVVLSFMIMLMLTVSGCGNKEDVSTTSDTPTTSDTSTEDVKKDSEAENKTEGSTEEATTEEETEATELEEEPQDEPKFGSSISGANLSIGDSRVYSFSSGDVSGEFILTFEDAGMEIVDDGSGGKVAVLYVVIEIENNTDSEVTLSDEYFAIYGDNYQLDVRTGLFDSPLSVETGIYSTEYISVNADQL